MRLNIKELKHAFSQLPAAQYAGEVIYLQVTDRVDSLNLAIVSVDVTKHITRHHQVVECVAVEYCRSEHDCWLEWEIKLL